MSKKNIQFISNGLYLAVISFLAIAIRGYQFGINDQVIQLPILYKLSDATLFPADTMFPTVMSNATLLYPIVLSITKFFNNNYFASFLFLYILTNLFLFIGFFLFTKTITASKKAAYISGLFFILVLPVAGSATSVVETSFVPRLVGTVILLFCLTFFFRKKYKSVYFLLGILFLIHPLSSVLLLLLIIPTQFLDSPGKSLPVIFRGSVVFLFTSIWFIPTFLKNNPTFNQSIFVSTQWLNILRLRNAYSFPLLWSNRSWMYLGILLIPLIAYLLYKKYYIRRVTRTDKLSLLFLLVSFFILITQIIFTTVLPLSIIIQLQLGRIWLIPIILSFVYSAYVFSKITDRFNINLKTLKVVTILGLIVIIIVKKDSFFKLQSQEWIDVQKWANTHTSKFCTFLVDFNSQGFRVYSRRPIVGEYKDGALSFYSQVFAKTWDEKRRFFDKSNRFENSEERIFYIRQKYPFSLVVTSNAKNILLPRLYQNSTYSVYKMPQIDKSCSINI